MYTFLMGQSHAIFTPFFLVPLQMHCSEFELIDFLWCYHNSKSTPRCLEHWRVKTPGCTGHRGVTAPPIFTTPGSSDSPVSWILHQGVNDINNSAKIRQISKSSWGTSSGTRKSSLVTTKSEFQKSRKTVPLTSVNSVTIAQDFLNMLI